ncbi:hypothetical protein D9M69_571940 [compost metagenome]
MQVEAVQQYAIESAYHEGDWSGGAVGEEHGDGGVEDGQAEMNQCRDRQYVPAPRGNGRQNRRAQDDRCG